MENNKALVWIRDDFRVNHNSALAYASENHEQVSTVYIFNPEDYLSLIHISEPTRPY